MTHGTTTLTRAAASATFALNSALNTQRVRRADDLLIIISRQGLSRLGKKPSMALIEPVQFCRATSHTSTLGLSSNIKQSITVLSGCLRLKRDMGQFKTVQRCPRRRSRSVSRPRTTGAVPVCQHKPEPIDFELMCKSGCSGDVQCQSQPLPWTLCTCSVVASLF